MKLFNKTIFTIILSFFLSNIQAQTYYPMSFFIVDNTTGNPIANARVSIKELGYQSVDSGIDGKAFFQDVPVGEIHYFVTSDGYIGADGTFNITTETKSNTLRIKLAKIPTKKINMMLISGEVIDETGKDINHANVELRAGRDIQNVKTDESGNFNIDVNLDNIDNGVTEFLLEVTKGECKKKDKFLIPKNRYLYKEVIIRCDEVNTVSKSKDKLSLNDFPQQWVGNYDQFNYPKPYKMVLYIEESIGGLISGKLNWPDLRNSVTSFTGEIVERPEGFIEETKWKVLDNEIKSDDGIWIKFIENSLISGSGIQLKGEYYCHISNKGILTGIGFSQNSTTAGGKFTLKKIK